MYPVRKFILPKKLKKFFAIVSAIFVMIIVLYSTEFLYSARDCNFITFEETRARMGNRMFQYASFYGISKMTKKKPFLKNSNFSLNNIFNLSIAYDDYYSYKNFIVNRENSWSVFRESSTHLPCNENVTLRGYRQSYKYFDQFKDKIKNEFKFKNNILTKCEQIFNESLKILNMNMGMGINCFVVGAHMRRGDFVRLRQRGHIPASSDYLQKSIEYFEDRFLKKYDCVKFLIAGDNRTWNSLNAPNKSNVLVLPTNSAEVDLCIMTHCNGIIMTTGSFSWWAAYLADGPTTYMESQCTPNSSLCKSFKLEDYINPNWDWTPL